jgi:uncharacterized protein (DUF488 family)
MEIYSIGFTQTSAELFFERLREAGIRRLVDVRLNNSSQLAAFAKRDDLQYFLRSICGIEYSHEPLLAPTAEMLDQFKKKKGAWDKYEQSFLELMSQRRIEDKLERESFQQPTVLLCSEPTPEYCHRRLVLEYLAAHWGDISITHL